MQSKSELTLAAFLVLAATACNQAPPAKQVSAPQAPPSFTVYVSNENSGDVTVIDGDKLERLAAIPVGKRPRGIHPSPDGRTVYVALSGSPPAPPGVDESKLPPPDKSADGIGVINVAEGKVVRTIKGGSDPEQFDLSKDGRQIFVSNEDDGKVTVIEIANGAILASVPVGGEPEGVTTSPDGKVVYVTSEEDGTVTAVDVAAHKPIRTIRTGRRPRSVAFLPNGTRAYVTNENDGGVTLVDAVKHQLIRQIPLGEPGKVKPMHVTMSADGATAFVSSGRGKKVFAIDTATNTIKGSVEVGDRPWGIALSPDQKTLFAADGPSGNLVVVDLATMSVGKKIKTGDGPWGVAVVPR
jgi:YVTN family beta-propeller protein